MNVKDIISVIESFAPLSAQEEYDNSGLIVGRFDAEINGILLCVDITNAVLDEALELGCELVVSHHPIIFTPLKRLTDSSYVESVVARAIRSGIALYACHTNLDSVSGGLSWRLADELGILNCRLLTGNIDFQIGFGVVGELDSEIDAMEFLKLVKAKLSIDCIRHSSLDNCKIRKVALCTGSGSSLFEDAIASGADLYLSAEFKYNAFLDAYSKIIIADIGHFESEYCAVSLLNDILKSQFSTLSIYQSIKGNNPVNYLV